MKLLYIILISLLCCEARANNLDCKKIDIEKKIPFSIYGYRCENEEVICYYFSGFREGGLSCKFK